MLQVQAVALLPRGITCVVQHIPLLRCRLIQMLRGRPPKSACFPDAAKIASTVFSVLESFSGAQASFAGKKNPRPYTARAAGLELPLSSA